MRRYQPGGQLFPSFYITVKARKDYCLLFVFAVLVGDPYFREPVPHRKRKPVPSGIAFRVHGNEHFELFMYPEHFFLFELLSRFFPQLFRRLFAAFLLLLFYVSFDAIVVFLSAYPFFVLVLGYYQRPVVVKKRSKPVDDLRISQVYLVQKHPVSLPHGADKVPLAPLELVALTFRRDRLAYKLCRVALRVEVHPHEVVPRNAGHVPYHGRFCRAGRPHHEHAFVHFHGLGYFLQVFLCRIHRGKPCPVAGNIGPVFFPAVHPDPAEGYMIGMGLIDVVVVIR